VNLALTSAQKVDDAEDLKVFKKAFPCVECKQEFDTQKELDLHMTYIHKSKSAD